MALRLPSTGYVLPIVGVSNLVVSANNFFGNSGQTAASATGAQQKIFIPKAGVIKVAELFTYHGVAGTAEGISAYIRLNDTTDTLIATVAAATNARRWTNTALAIAVQAGDFIEIKIVGPAWVTTPSGAQKLGGHVYIE